MSQSGGKSECQDLPIRSPGWDRNTDFLDADIEKQVNEANDKYSPEERQKVIDFCRLDAFRKSTQMVDKERVEKSLKDKNGGLIFELQEEFMNCARDMLHAWQEQDIQDEKDSKR